LFLLDIAWAGSVAVFSSRGEFPMMVKAKENVKLSLYLITSSKHCAMKTCGENGGIALPFLISTLVEGEW
jgi:hypothetical protein